MIMSFDELRFWHVWRWLGMDWESVDDHCEVSKRIMAGSCIANQRLMHAPPCHASSLESKSPRLLTLYVTASLISKSYPPFRLLQPDEPLACLDALTRTQPAKMSRVFLPSSCTILP